MTLEIVSVLLTGIGVLIGVWRIQAHYENRNDRAHADLGRRIDGLGTRVETLGDGLGTRVEGLSTQVVKVAADVAYLRGRQDERDRGVAPKM